MALEAFTNNGITAEQLKEQAEKIGAEKTATHLPQIKEFTGTVTSYEERKGVIGKILTMEGLDGEVRTFVVNEAQGKWNGFKDLVEGQDFTISFEERIEGKTTWTNKATGESGVHTKSGVNVVGCKKAFKRQVGMKILEDKMMSIYNKSEGDVALTQAFGAAFAAFLK